VLQIAITETVRSGGSVYLYSDRIRGCNVSCGHHEGTEDSEVQPHNFSTSALNADWLYHVLVDLTPRGNLRVPIDYQCR